jgi:ribonuclease P protein component
MGFAVPKKRVPHAADRNRIRRLMREVYRMNRSTLHEGVEEAARDLRIVVVFQHGGSTPLYEISFKSVQQSWIDVAAKILSTME